MTRSIEQLESRRLLSAYLTYRGTLAVFGTSGDDTVNIYDGHASVNGAGGSDTLNLYGDSTATYKNVEMVNDCFVRLTGFSRYAPTPRL